MTVATVYLQLSVPNRKSIPDRAEIKTRFIGEIPGMLFHLQPRKLFSENVPTSFFFEKTEIKFIISLDFSGIMK